MATNKTATTQTPQSHAESFRKTRIDHSQEIAEDYVEAIAQLQSEEGTCRVTRLAKQLGVSHVTANRTVSRLVTRGLVTTTPYQPIELTKQGKVLAAAARKRHETVLRFLLALGVPEKTAKSDAEGIEHHCSHTTIEAMKRFCSNKRT
jgi:DtxR family manganese transport transcriptional regulator